MNKNKQQQIDELNASIDYCCAMANLNCEWSQLADSGDVDVPKLDEVNRKINSLPVNEAAKSLWWQACQEGHYSNAYALTMGQRWMWCAAQFRRWIDNLNQAAPPIDPVDELTKLRLLCKRILATYDSSGYAKGSVQELWREFKREVEK